jgi:hypothetical protein
MLERRERRVIISSALGPAEGSSIATLTVIDVGTALRLTQPCSLSARTGFAFSCAQSLEGGERLGLIPAVG